MKKVLKWLGIGFAGILVLGMFAGGEETEPVSNDNNNTVVVEEKEDFEFIEGPNMETTSYGSPVITGIIKNNSGRDKEYVQVSFTLYDADGNNIGTALANVNNLKADGTWKFEAVSFEDNVASFEIDEITGF